MKTEQITELQFAPTLPPPRVDELLEVTNDYYVKVHTGRDYGDVPPVRGVYRGPFAHTLEVSVRVLSDPV